MEAADPRACCVTSQKCLPRKTNVIGVQTQSVKGTAWMTFTVEVADSGRLNKVLGIVASGRRAFGAQALKWAILNGIY